MPSAASRSKVTTAALVVVGITVWRLVALSLDGTDLWVDEAQYWYWGQNLDWGYFSKPPMIAWLSRAVTDMAGSDAIFWVRFPGPLLHATTAVLIGVTTARLVNTETGALAAMLYITLPMATLGSWQFSTDSVLLPFFALAVLSYVSLTFGASIGWALVLGCAVGLGLLSKYAMIYLPIGAAVAWILAPRARIAARDLGVAAIVALIVFSPNLFWNIGNGGTTLRHTAQDNARIGAADPSVARAVEFVASQFAVFGPILFAVLIGALIASLRRRAPDGTGWMLALALPTIMLMAVQAYRAQAHANWAVTAYVAGTIAVALVLITRPRLAWVSLGLHLAIAALFPLLFIFPTALSLPDGRLLAQRYLGQATLSQQIAEVATANGLATIVSTQRSVAADLAHTLRDSALRFRALAVHGVPKSFYEQSFPYEGTEPALLVTQTPEICGNAIAITTLTPSLGLHRGAVFHLMRLPEDCAR